MYMYEEPVFKCELFLKYLSEHNTGGKSLYQFYCFKGPQIIAAFTLEAASAGWLQHCHLLCM